MATMRRALSPAAFSASAATQPHPVHSWEPQVKMASGSKHRA
ncbi:MAG: hypothetical protein ABIF71_13405 [Planctomycetota bacterium]